MDFLFKSQADLNKAELFQGDLLARTPVLREAIAQAHGYYADAEGYSHFMVLTQSCDLVRRRGRPPKSRYITLAACRPLSVVLDRAKASQQQSVGGLPIPVLAAEKRVRATQLLERLLHNTEDGFFFIRRNSVQGVEDDLCAFLPLSIALRADAHYGACAASKIGELQDIFAAKLGWMTGNLYSRIGTPDIEEKRVDAEEYKRAFVGEFLPDEREWLTPVQIRWLSEQARAWTKQHPGEVMTAVQAEQLQSSVPTSEAIMAEDILYALRHANLIDANNLDRAKNVLSSSSALKRMAKQGLSA